MMTSLLLALSAHAQSLNSLWQKVESAVKDDNPQEVVLQSGKLYELAKTQRNVPEMLRAYLTRMNWRQALSPDSLETDRAGLLKWADETEDPVDQSVLYFIYGLTVSGIEETDDFGYLKKALAWDNPSLYEKLAATSALKYKPVVVSGDASELYHHDLLSLYRRTLQDFHWSYHADKSWVSKIYARDMEFYRTQNRPDAALAVALDWDLYRNEYELPKPRTVFLNDLIRDFSRVPLCAEVERRLAEEEKLEDALPRLRRAIATYPKYERINELKVDLDRRIQPNAHFTAASDVFPGKKLKVDYHLYNISSIQVRWKKVDESVYLYHPLHESYWMVDQEKKILKQSSFVSEPVKIPISDKPYDTVSSSFTLDVPSAPGYYLLEIKPLACTEYPAEKVAPSYLLQLVSHLKLVVVPVKENQKEVRVFDAWSGKPVPGATVNEYELDRKSNQFVLRSSQRTDKDGILIYPQKDRKPIYLSAQDGKDRGRISNLTVYYPGEQSARVEKKANLYTDRSVYRPGQDVQYSIILWHQHGDSTKVLPNEKLLLVLAGGRKWTQISEDSLTTDGYGVAHGTFHLPEACLPGDYSITTDAGYVHFKVEEYKRPTFDVEWLPCKADYGKGDTVVLTGQASLFSDLPVQHAKVAIKVVRRQRLWWRIMDEAVLKEETLLTDENGAFAIPVHLKIPDDFSESHRNPLYDFQVEATVTSQSGESHVAYTHLRVAEIPYQFWADIESRNNKGKLNLWTVHLTNLNQEDLQKDVHAEILQKEDGKVVWQGSVKSGKSFTPDFLKELPSGKYSLKLSYDSLHVDEDILLFSMEDKKPVEETPLWLYAETTEFDKVHDGVLQIGTSYENAYLVYNIYSGNKRVQSSVLQLSDELTCLNIPYKDAYGDGIQVLAFLVHEGNVHQSSWNFSLTKPEKRMKAEWISFRDFSQPGAKESWKLRLTLPNGKPADANMMAVLYDASLDRILGHRWGFSMFFGRYIPSFNLAYLQSFSNANLTFPSLVKYVMKRKEFDEFDSSLVFGNRFGFGFGKPIRMMAATRIVMNKANAVEDSMVEYAMEESANVTVAGAVAEAKKDAVEEDIKEAEAPMNLRTDFQETAFFYPVLRTNKEGVVQLDFTLPQSVTEWHLLGLAHTQGMDYTDGIDKTLKVVQPLMVQPNMPRFVRNGDVVGLPVTIRNQSGKALKGNTTLVLKDSTLTKTLLTLQLPYEVKASGETTVTFEFKVPAYVGGAVCQVYASSDGFSDGEQHELPILSDEIWLEENRAYYLNASEEMVSLEQMMNHGKLWGDKSSMTVKVVNNPVWEIVRELTETAKKENPSTWNAVDLALNFYTQCLSLSIVGSQPTLKEAEMLPTDTLLAVSYLTQIEKLQNEDGGFSWYTGMGSSPYITRILVESFVRLSSLQIGVPDQERFDRIVRRGMYYLDKEMLSYYEWVKKQKNFSGLNNETIHYLYLCALNPHLMSKANKAACEYFVGELSKELSSLSIYQKAMASIVLQEFKKQNEALKFVRSAVSYSVYTDELGRYYDTAKAGYSWRNYKIPTQTMVIESVSKVAPATLQVTSSSSPLAKDRLISEYTRWLLNQKRTQFWENSANTLDALYAILNASDTKLHIKMTDAQTKVETYSYQDFKDMPKIWKLAKSESDSPVAWANVTMKSLVKIDDVVAETPRTGFKLEVEYQKEVSKNGKVRYESVNLDNLKVGDKIHTVIRLKVDRDMDFVEVNVPRAACFEPVSTLSGFRWGKNLGYYYMIRDKESVFCMDHLPKGNYELTEDFYVVYQGTYSSGIPTAQCTYAPEFSVHGESKKVLVR